MSDVPHDRDWWLASDDKWYPPEQHPGYGQRISAGDVGLESAAYEDPVAVDELPDDPMPDLEPVVIEIQPEPEIEPTEPEPEPVAEVFVAPAAEPGESPDSSDIEETPIDGQYGEVAVDGSSFVDRLFELSEQRVAGEIDDDEFADAQTRLIQGD